MEPQLQLEDEVYCTACRTPYRKPPEATVRRCPTCGDTAWIAAAFVHVREPVEADARRP